MNGISGSYGNNLMQMAVASFVQSGNLMSQGMSLGQSPAINALQNVMSTFTQGTGQMSMGFFSMGSMQAPGFLSPPMGMGAPMAQQASSMGMMMQPWNGMGNLLNTGRLGGQMGQLQGQMGMAQNMLQGLAMQMGQLAGMLNRINAGMGMKGQINHAQQAANLGGPLAQNPAALNGGVAGLNTNTQQAQPGFKFPGVAANDFIGKLPKSKGGVASMLNVSGRRDVNLINSAVGKLKTAKVGIQPTGAKKGKASLDLTPAQVNAIRNAPDAASAKKLALEILGKKAGVDVTDLNMSNKGSIRNDKYRNAVNKLLGTSIRRGREKNSGSALLLDSMAESMVKSVKGGSFGARTIQTPGGMGFMAFGGGFAGAGMQQTMGGFAQQSEMGTQWSGAGAANMMGMGGMFGGMGMWLVPGASQTIPNPTTGVSVDLGEFGGAAGDVAKLASPLIFDLEGTGLQLSDEVRMIAVDIDGDGEKEWITDIDAELGLLIFDSTGEGIRELTGADMFGDNTDLTHYGITAPNEDGKFKDGFQALRALCEHFRLIDAGKQFLDVSDLAFLEEKVGLRMRVGGIDNGEQRSFEEVGISQINLGNPEQTQHIDDAPEDRWGNKMMFQDGATFTVYSEVRQYADIWFKIQARYEDAPDENLNISSVDLLNLGRRR